LGHSNHHETVPVRAKNTPFSFFPQLNGLEKTSWMKSSLGINYAMTDLHFHSDTLQDKFLRAMAKDNTLPIKEILESFEYFSRIRKQLKNDCVLDLCSGHGLLGILFAMFERRVKKVVLVDVKVPPSYQKLFNCAVSVAPWIRDKIETFTEKIHRQASWAQSGCSVVSAHACGVLTDTCIDVAIACGGPLAVLPCCYPRKACRAPLALQQSFGLQEAFDIDRTYRLENADFRVRWSSIPAHITPMNRIMIATPKNSQAHT
jgi:hypothetical protein